MRPVHRQHRHLLAKPVDEHAHHLVLPLQRHPHRLTAVHSEQPLGVYSRVKPSHPLLPQPGRLQQGDALHLVHPIVLHPVRLGVVGNEVVVLVVPPQMPWADAVPPAVPAQRFLLLHRPLKVLETDLLSLSDGSMELIDVVVDALIHCLYSSRHIYLTLQFLCLIFTNHFFQLLNQRIRFLFCDEFGRLNCIYQKFQLR